MPHFTNHDARQHIHLNDRKLAEGHTVAEHADAYTKFLREWPAPLVQKQVKPQP